MNRPTLLVAAVLVASLLAACGPSTGDGGSIPTGRPSADPSVGQGSPDVTPSSPTPVPSSPAPSSPGSSPSPSPTPAPSGTTIVRAYFFLTGDVGTAGVVPVLRELSATTGVARAAITELLAGPNAEERTAGIATTIPDGVELLGISIEGGVATVDLSREFESGGGSASMFGRLAQVVFTLTQFPTVDAVRFELEGEPVTVFSGEGIVLDGPVGREDYRDQLPAIFVDRPAWGAALLNPGRVTGLANVFEATFRIALLDEKGDILRDESVMATCGTGCWGTFDVTLTYDVAEAQWGTLRVYDPSEVDGSPESIRDYRVWLTPAG